MLVLNLKTTTVILKGLGWYFWQLSIWSGLVSHWIGYSLIYLLMQTMLQRSRCGEVFTFHLQLGSTFPACFPVKWRLSPRYELHKLSLGMLFLQSHGYYDGHFGHKMDSKESWKKTEKTLCVTRYPTYPAVDNICFYSKYVSFPCSILNIDS